MLNVTDRRVHAQGLGIKGELKIATGREGALHQRLVLCSASDFAALTVQQGDSLPSKIAYYGVMRAGEGTGWGRAYLRDQGLQQFTVSTTLCDVLQRSVGGVESLLYLA